MAGAGQKAVKRLLKRVFRGTMSTDVASVVSADEVCGCVDLSDITLSEKQMKVKKTGLIKLQITGKRSILYHF